MSAVRKPRIKRSSKWAALEKRCINKHPFCAVCGNTKRKELRGHHKIPVHVDQSKELLESNIIILCQGKVVNCHLLFGHLRDWKDYNPEVDQDAEIWRNKIAHKPESHKDATTS